MDRRVLTLIEKAGASMLFVGYVPVASGTVGSALAVGLVWLLHRQFPVLFAPESAMLYWLAMLAAIALSIVLSGRAAEHFGREDPSQIVVDEFVGQLVVFFMVPITWRTLLLGFLLFRFFDIVKPFPIYTMEDIEGGVGITMDDVLAGVCANIGLIVVLFLYHAVRAAL